eukprot:gene4455-8875_t
MESNQMKDAEGFLECSVCLNLICEPISIPCGHSFCRVCLFKSLKKCKQTCPSCRAVCHVSPEDAPENIIIKSIAKLVNPNLYELRLKESVAEASNWTKLLPIFYYNSIMYPGESLNLHLFEPRYRVMMRRVVDSTNSFAYVANFNTYCARVGDLALLAKLEHVEFFHDGRCMIRAVLTSRHKIVEHFEIGVVLSLEGTQGLHMCRLEDIHDEPIGNSEEIQTELSRLMALAQSHSNVLLHHRALQDAYSRYGSPPSGAEKLSLWLLALFPMDETYKLTLMSSTDTMARLTVCVQMLQVMCRGLRLEVGVGVGVGVGVSTQGGRGDIGYAGDGTVDNDSSNRMSSYDDESDGEEADDAEDYDDEDDTRPGESVDIAATNTTTATTPHTIEDQHH